MAPAELRFRFPPLRRMPWGAVYRGYVDPWGDEWAYIERMTVRRFVERWVGQFNGDY